MSTTNDQILFDDFYEQNYNQVYWYIYKKINHKEEAQDLASEVFCSCYRNFEKYDPEKSSIKTWLYVIVNNKLKNYYRDRKISVPFDERLDEHIPQTNDYMSQSIILDEYRDILADTISALPEKDQMIIILKYFGDKQSDEIAQILNMSAVNVRVKLSRSLKKISEQLVKCGWKDDM